jgi:hypothetical protein
MERNINNNKMLEYYIARRIVQAPFFPWHGMAPTAERERLLWLTDFPRFLDTEVKRTQHYYCSYYTKYDIYCHQF